MAPIRGSARPSGPPAPLIDSLTASAEPSDAKVLPFEVVPEREARPYENCIPLLTVEAAAGQLSNDEELVEAEAWVRPKGVKVGPGLFVTQVVGESMNRRIPNGAFSLFRTSVAGSRDGRVVLVEHRDIVDPELGGPATVKVWESDKEAVEDSWRHTEIRLKPDSDDPSFEPIVLRDVNEDDLQVAGELISVLGLPQTREQA